MRYFCLFAFAFISSMLFAQSNQPWASHFSYTSIQDMSQSNSRMYAAAESAIFSKSTTTNEIKTLTSVDGLKPETITAIHYSSTYNRTLVGSSNGLLIVVNGDNSILNKVDIIEETTVQPSRKRINNIDEFNGIAYISCDFGIAVFNLETLEFGDTYFLGPNGAEISVLQTTVNNGYLYAATPQNGIVRGLLSNPNLNDYTQWMQEYSGSFTGIGVFGDQLFATDSNGSLLRLQGGNTFNLAFMGSPATDIREANGYLVVTSASRILVYGEGLIQVLQLNGLPNEDVVFTCATIVSGQIFIGTQEDGVIQSALTNIAVRENITPEGPLYSNIFSLEFAPNGLWAVYGSYNFFLTPDLSEKGVSRLTEEGWESIAYEDVFEAESLSDIAVNPSNPSDVYVSSYHNGLVRLEGLEPVILYNETNSPLQNQQVITPTYYDLRVNSLAFDSSGGLWMTNDQTDKPLVVFRNGNWSSYSFEDVTTNPRSDRYQRMAIDRNGTKWIPSINNGLIGFNEAAGNKFMVLKGESVNMPSEYVRCVAVDNNNRLWIGTARGLRVLPGTDLFLTEDILTVNEIIIEEDGLAQELLYEQIITDIEVDGSNNKWIATAGAGAFLVSPDGQRTIFHFTNVNSPLPSNTVNDIAIDQATGEVFFATDRGMVSYKGTATEAADDLNNVYVYPNPVRPGFEGDVKISGLIDNANIKITDIEGNLVHETTSEGGTVLWDTRAFGRYKVASGVYMIFIASDDGTKTKVKKVMIIR
jgi:hypothetical protein